ncbi:hypothetical protein YC2023_032970 [Brassica napus]
MELQLECPPLGSSLGHCGIYIWAAASETEDRYTVSHMMTPWQRPCSLRSLVWTTSMGPGYSRLSLSLAHHISDLLYHRLPTASVSACRSRWFHIQGSRGGGSSTRSGVTTQWGVGFGRWSRLFMAEREDHVSPLDISRDLCVRGGVEGALLGLVVRAHLLSVEVKDCSGVLSGDELRVLVCRWRWHWSRSNSCGRAKWAIFLVVYGRIKPTFSGSRVFFLVSPLTPVTFCESHSLSLRFSKVARDVPALVSVVAESLLCLASIPVPVKDFLFFHRYGGDSSELSARLGGSFKRCVVLCTSRVLVAYSGGDLRIPGIRGNKENLTFSGFSSMGENSNQFQGISKRD